MTMEATLVRKNRSVIEHANNIIRKKKWRKTKRCMPPMPMPMPIPIRPPSMALQNLFVACREVFKGPGTVPPPRDVHNLRQILDNMKPEDVGLSTDLFFFKPKSADEGTPSITYTTIYKSENFSMCIFFLPPSGVIPLHNHPGMTVFSKLLLGSMHIKSYDLVDHVKVDNSMQCSQLRLARLQANDTFTSPCNTSVLYPTSGGNIHAFTALSPCAVLDVIGPPYSKQDGRDCTYYRDIPCPSFSDGNAGEAKEGKECYGLLEEIEMPKDLKMEGIEYLGPQVIETYNSLSH